MSQVPQHVPMPRRLIAAIAVASGAVTIAIAVTIGAVGGYLHPRGTTATASPPVAEPVQPPAAVIAPTVLVPVQPTPAPAPVAEAPPPPAAAEAVLTYTADPPRYAHDRDDHDRDHDREDDDE